MKLVDNKIVRNQWEDVNYGVSRELREYIGHRVYYPLAEEIERISLTIRLGMYRPISFDGEA